MGFERFKTFYKKQGVYFNFRNPHTAQIQLYPPLSVTQDCVSPTKLVSLSAACFLTVRVVLSYEPSLCFPSCIFCCHVNAMRRVIIVV